MPDDCFAHLPWALVHSPIAPRRFEAQPTVERHVEQRRERRAPFAYGWARGEVAAQVSRGVPGVSLDAQFAS